MVGIQILITTEYLNDTRLLVDALKSNKYSIWYDIGSDAVIGDSKCGYIRVYNLTNKKFQLLQKLVKSISIHGSVEYFKREEE